MTDHERLHDFAAAHALGALEPDDRREFEGHLAECESCRAEVARFAPIPGLLSRASTTHDASLPASVVSAATKGVREEWTTMKRSRRRWRLTAIAAVTVALALSWSTLGSSGARPDVVLSLGDGPVTGEVSIESKMWGSALTLDLDGLPQRDRYIAWIVAGDGTRQQACTWGPTAAGRAHLNGAAAVPASEVRSVVITDGEGTDVLATASV